MSSSEMYQPQVKNLTSSTVVFSGKGFLNQIIIDAHSSAVLDIGNGTTSILSLKHSSMALATGERWIPFNGEVYEDGCYIVIAAGTATLSVQYRKNA